MSTEQTISKLEMEPRAGRQRVNIAVDVSYAKGGDILVNEAFAVESDDHLFSAAEHLREMADRLDPRGW